MSYKGTFSKSRDTNKQEQEGLPETECFVSIRSVRDDSEKLLVVPRGLVEDAGMFQGLTLDIERYLPLLMDNRNWRFVERGKAEGDESLKQIIPYFIITHENKLWCYVRGRKSGEDRLVAKASIGIGGHINSSDENLFDTYDAAALRELNEELVIAEGYRHRIVALLNDDSNPVGRVHLGIVHVLRTPSAEIRKRESAITEAAFKTVEQVRAIRARLETWSRICLDEIDRLLERADQQ